MSSVRIAQSFGVERLDSPSAWASARREHHPPARKTPKKPQLQMVEPKLLPPLPTFSSIIDDFWLLLKPIIFPRSIEQPRQKMRGKVTVIVLDLKNNLDEELQVYWQLTAVQKINLLAQHIDDIATRYEKKHPKRMLIFTWREYGICKKESRFIDVKIKNRLKETMQGLTRKHPSIAIIAGTVASIKPCVDIAPELKKDAKKTFKKLEGKYFYDSHYAKKYRKLFDKLDNSSNKFKVTNSCYMFLPNGVVDRVDKELPYNELYDQIRHKYLSANTFFLPGKVKTRNKIKEMMHPYTQEKFYMGLEICIEHSAGLLGAELKKLQRSQQCKIDLQIVSSASVELKQRNIIGDDFVHADSDNGVSFVQNNLEHKRLNLDVVASRLQMR